MVSASVACERPGGTEQRGWRDAGTGKPYVWPVALHDMTDREAVLRAMAEADEIGESRFLDKYGFGESRRYRIVH